jgi:hypothetical protein
VAAVPFTDQIGFVLAAFFAGFHFWRSRQVAKPAIGQ